MEYLIVLLFIHLFFGLLIENVRNRFLYIFLGLFAFIIALVFTVGIRDNSDWKMYYYLFKLNSDTTDFMFIQLTQIFKSWKLKFEDLYSFHMICIVILFSLLILRFTKNLFYVLILYLMLDFVHLSNQIRYYLGFPIMLFGLYYLLNSKKRLIGILLIFLSLLFHKGLAMLILFIPVYHLIKDKSFIRYMLSGSLILGVLVVSIVRFGIGISLEHFDYYLGSNNESSLVGGFFNALPYILYFGFIIIEHYNITSKHPEVLEDSKTLFLMKLTFFPLIFLFSAFFVQILGHRYIMPFVIFLIIYYLRLLKNLPHKKRFIRMVIFTMVNVVALFSIYILPDYFLSTNHYLEELKDILKSISYFKNLL